MRIQRVAVVRLLLLLALLLAIPSATRAQEPPTEEAPTPQSLEELEQRLKEIMEATHLPGAAVILVSDDEVLWEGYLGVADVASNRPVTPETRFRIGSISKSFVALVALQLQEAGRLDLNAPYSTLAPDMPIANRWEATDPVRLVHLIEHTAGLPNLNPRHYLLDDATISLHDALADSAPLHRTLWRPGSYGMYSNIGPAMAAYAIEQVIGQPYEAYVQSHLFDPLGMDTATFVVTDEDSASVATSYAADGQTVRPLINIGVRPSGSITVEPRQMAPFLQMLLNEGSYDGQTLLQPASIERMRRPATMLAAQNGLELGYGLGIYATENQGFTFYGHNGGIDGFLSEYAILPDAGRGYFLNINSANGDAMLDMIKAIEGYLTHDLTAPPAPPVVEVSTAELDALVGAYELTTPLGAPITKPLERTLATIVVQRVDQQLQVTVPGSLPQTLIPLGPRQFRTEEGRSISYVFSDDPEYGMVMQGNVGLNARRIPEWQLYLRLGLVALFVVSLLSTLLFALVWGLRLLLRRLNAPHLSVRVLPLLAILSLLGLVVTFLAASSASDPAEVLGTPSLPAIAIMLLTVLFALFSVAGIVQAVRGLRWPIHRGVKIHSLFASGMNLILTLAMAAWGLIGYMPWR